MLYEYNGKFYVKPFSNKLVEVNVDKESNELDLKPTKKVVVITPEVKSKMVEVNINTIFENIGKRKRINTI